MNQYSVKTDGLSLEQQFELSKFAGQLEAAPPQVLRQMLLEAMCVNFRQRNWVAEQAKAGHMANLPGILGQMG